MLAPPFPDIMYDENDLLPISALQHLVFCERQCALIHIEQVWTENSLTVEGRHLHERVDEYNVDTKPGVRTVRAMPLRSLHLGIIGRADVIEFHKEGSGARPYPVEYKRGKPKPDRCDEVQLCAQALCIEEMLGIAVPAGALFYGKIRRRTHVDFDEALRDATHQYIEQLRHLFSQATTPQAIHLPKCDNCSLKDTCLPAVTSGRRSAKTYLKKMILEAAET